MGWKLTATLAAIVLATPAEGQQSNGTAQLITPATAETLGGRPRVMPLIFYTTARLGDNIEKMKKLCTVFFADSVYVAEFNSKPFFIGENKDVKGGIMAFGSMQPGDQYRDFVLDTIHGYLRNSFIERKWLNVDAIMPVDSLALARLDTITGFDGSGVQQKVIFPVVHPDSLPVYTIRFAERCKKED